MYGCPVALMVSDDQLQDLYELLDLFDVLTSVEVVARVVDMQ